MAGSASEPTLADIAVQAGAGSEITTYLEQRGLRSAGALALIASDVDQLDNVLVAPLLAGWRPDPADPGIQLSDDEKPIAKAVLRFMWVLATEARKRAAANAVTTSTTTSPATSSVAPAVETKTPKTLPAGEWRALIDRYNKITLNGEPREFPEEELLGAESVVARVLHEHRTTKNCIRP